MDIGFVLELDEEKTDLVVHELLQTGLAEAMSYGFLRFHPELCPYLLQKMGEGDAERGASLTRWAKSMKQLSGFLYENLFKDAQLALDLTTLELPNMVRLLDYTREQGNPEKTVGLATSLEQLVEYLGRRSLLAHIVSTRETEAKKLKEWNHAWFGASKSQIERLFASRNIPQALQEAQALLDKCVQAGETAYPDAAYDTAVAYFLLVRGMNMGGASEAALQPIDEAYSRFQQLAEKGNESAARTVSASLTEKGGCLRNLGRLDEAAEAYEAGIQIDEKNKNFRGIAVGKGQLGTVRMVQKRYDEALATHKEAREIFENLGEPSMVATAWCQIGAILGQIGRFDEAEHALRQALSTLVRYNFKADEAATLNQLGILYNKMGRLEEAVKFYRQAADKFIEINDMADEGFARNNLANTLIKLKRFKEARVEIVQAIECKTPYGHASLPWTTWMVLHDLERAVGNNEAAKAARDKAIQLFLKYRRDGGENHNQGGRICLWFTQALHENRIEEIENQLTEWGNNPAFPEFGKVLISKLKAILAGSRDPGLAADPELFYMDAVEILLLLETLREGERV